MAVATTHAKAPLLDVAGVSRSYEDHAVFRDISFQVMEGETVGIIGPNGTGKSTLLKLLSGVESPDAGNVRFAGQPLASYSRKSLAAQVAVLQQEGVPPVRFTVREVIEMGRFPFQNWFGEERDGTRGDNRVDLVLERLHLLSLAERALEHLSGGERQRVALGKVMAQQPKLLLLDEPTTYLDIGYQIQMMDTIRQWQQEEQLTIVAVLHDLNLAAQYCDRLLLLHEGRIVQMGTPEQVLTAATIRDVYGTEPIVVPHPADGAPQLLLQPAHTALAETVRINGTGGMG